MTEIPEHLMRRANLARQRAAHDNALGRAAGAPPEAVMASLIKGTRAGRLTWEESEAPGAARTFTHHDLALAGPFTSVFPDSLLAKAVTEWKDIEP